MCTKRELIFCVLVAGFALGLGCPNAAAQAQDNQDSTKAKKSYEKVITYGFEERIRSENWNNIIDYNGTLADERHQVRYRTKLWMNIPLGSHVDFYAGLNDEFKKQTTPDLKLDPDEVIVENLYLNFNNIFTPGLSLRVGRQNIMKGDGILLFDGNSLDGSRTQYFNAVDLSYAFKKSTFELIGILDPCRDRFLPRINDKNKPLTEWDEQAVGYYYTDKNHPKTQFESYYFYKKETHDYRAAPNPQFQPDRHVNTAGGRVVQKLGGAINLTGEFAYQWGHQHPNTEIRAWGGYGYLRRTFDHRWTPYLQAGYWAFSGDDPSTPEIEGWDPLFSRWPKWSELYIYSQILEKGVAYWTNIGLVQAEAGFAPCKPLGVRMTYYHVNAFYPFPGNPQIFSNGKNRGDMYQARMDIKVNKNVSGHVLYENQVPGNYYKAGDDGYFVRFEIIYSLSEKISLAHSK